MTTLDPASAVAAAICHLSREASPIGVSERHPGTCGWCDYPVEQLRRMVRDFDVTSRPAMQFRLLPGEAQRRLVREAQAIDA